MWFGDRSVDSIFYLDSFDMLVYNCLSLTDYVSKIINNKSKYN